MPVASPLPQIAAPRVRVRLQGCGVGGLNLPVWRSAAWLNTLQQGRDLKRNGLPKKVHAADWAARRLALVPHFDPSIQHLGTVAETLDPLYGKIT